MNVTQYLTCNVGPRRGQEGQSPKAPCRKNKIMVVEGSIYVISCKGKGL